MRLRGGGGRLRGGLLQRLVTAPRATSCVPLCPPPPARAARLTSLAQGLATVAAAALLHASPVAADGYEEALRLCPDERVVCVSSLDAGHFLEPWEYDGALGRAVRANVLTVPALLESLTLTTDPNPNQGALPLLVRALGLALRLEGTRSQEGAQQAAELP